MMMKILSKIIFWLFGWQAIGTFDYPKKCVVIAAPHTSNWDFFVGKCYGYISGVNAKYLIKSSFFIPVLGTLFKWNGGIPVYRNSNNNIVEQIVSRFNSSNNFRLGITPEGTRSRVEKWKTGFYHIALKANVPILLLAIDYKKKKIGIINSFFPSGDIDRDMLFIQHQFHDIQAKEVRNYNPIIR